jgi:hypothetical protein
MSLKNPKQGSTAEQEFRAAFQRLCDGRPQRIDKVAKVTQNNVAREAGRDPSALRASRYPALAAEIQARSQEQLTTRKRKARRAHDTSRSKIAELTAQRDAALSEALSLLAENARLLRQISLLEKRLASRNIVKLV